MRWQIAYPGHPFRRRLVAGEDSGSDVARRGVVQADLYNSFGAMHGTIMVFSRLCRWRSRPLEIMSFPLQDRGPDMAFRGSTWRATGLFPRAHHVRHFFIRAARQSAGPRIPPLATLADRSPLERANLLDHREVLVITSSLLGAVNFIATIIQFAEKGMSLDAVAFLCLGSVRPRFSCCWRFRPGSRRRHAVDGQPGGNEFLPADGTGVPVQRIRCRSAAAAVLVMAHCSGSWAPEFTFDLPAMGIVCEIGRTIAQADLGYKSMVYSVLCIGFLSFIVWAHHMYLTEWGRRSRRSSRPPR